MSSDPGWATWVVPVAQVFGQVIGWLVIVIGWRFISRDNDRRERRKEVRALLTEIRSAILSVEAEAYEIRAFCTRHTTSLAMQRTMV